MEGGFEMVEKNSAELNDAVLEQIIENTFADYPDVVGVDDLTKMLHIGKNKAYELLNTNMLKSIRIGKKHIIPKFRVIEFIKNYN